MRVDLNVPTTHTKEVVSMWGDGWVKESDCDNYFTLYVYIKSSCYIT